MQSLHHRCSFFWLVIHIIPATMMPCMNYVLTLLYLYRNWHHVHTQLFVAVVSSHLKTGTGTRLALLET